MEIKREYNALVEQIKKYNPTFDESRLSLAYEIARKAHEGQERVAGDPFITHPLSVAKILAQMELDCDSIIAGILHDCIEDTELTIAEIRLKFGEEVAYLVDGVTKLGKIPYSSKEEQQMENLRKMFLAMAKDVRVILIKLADRLHNMRTIGSLPDYKQRQKGLETLEVYSPIAHRLGMSKIKSELEDISIKCLDPIGCDIIEKTMIQKNAESKTLLEGIKERIGRSLDQYHIKYTIEGRIKHLFSIYRKVYIQNRGFDEVYDFFAIRIIVGSVIDCYNVLGVIHDCYRPLPNRFKDYISTPKPNMYQSLHTTVLNSNGLVFEVQIRTWEMHKVAEYGIAAHWKYKTGVSDNVYDKKLAWIRQLLEIQNDSNDSDEFMRALKIDMFVDEVFVFTPKGDVINLPSNSTIIDFAYSIHSEIGNKMTGAKVNGRIVTFDYILKTGDIVEISTAGLSSGPSLDWLKIAKSSQARNKIKQWFKKEKREENIERGRIELEKELRKNKIPWSQFENKEVLNIVYKKFHVNTLDDLYAGVGYGGIPIYKLIIRITSEVQRMNEALLQKNPELVKKQVEEQQARRARKSVHGIVVEGVDNVLIKFARCCNPLPGDDVIGYITKGYGVSVHKRDCANVTSSIEKEEEKSRWIPVYWSQAENSTFSSALRVLSDKKEIILVDVVNSVSNMKIPMHSVNAKSMKNGLTSIMITIEVQNLEQLNNVINRLSRLPGVIEVKRAGL